MIKAMVKKMIVLNTLIHKNKINELCFQQKKVKRHKNRVILDVREITALTVTHPGVSGEGRALIPPIGIFLFFSYSFL